MDVLVVGALHHDVIVNAPRLPELDETLKGQSVAYALGGKGGNQALSAARHGAKTGFAGATGSDETGRSMTAQLEKGGVDVSQIATIKALASGMSIAIVTHTGDYGAVIVSAANEAIDANAIIIPEGLKWLILQNEILPEINLAVAKQAKLMGANILLNAAPARDLDRALMALIDVLVVNRVEAQALTKMELEPNCTVIETLGGDGLHIWKSKTDWHFIPAFKVHVISTHGAGDCFVGALAARLCFGDNLKQAATYASAAAALHVSLPIEGRATITPQDVFKLMETRNADGN